MIFLRGEKKKDVHPTHRVSHSRRGGEGCGGGSQRFTKICNVYLMNSNSMYIYIFHIRDPAA